MSAPPLDVEIYQLVEDSMLKHNRSDGTGWDWSWADWQRDWMDATPHRFAYRCLPLAIVNQTGWWIKNPVAFTCTWHGKSEPGNVHFQFDSPDEIWGRWINNQFGEGIITWNTPFLFRTKPEGSRLLITGPTNYFKPNAQPLTALIESDWMSMSFTMNWKLTSRGQPVRFDVGEPLFQAIPIATNICADLERAVVSYKRLTDNPELNRSYREWDEGRRRFHDQKAAGAVKPNDWQKDYFQGRDAAGQEVASRHMTKVKPPRVHFGPPASPTWAEPTGDRGDTEPTDHVKTAPGSCPFAHGHHDRSSQSQSQPTSMGSRLNGSIDDGFVSNDETVEQSDSRYSDSHRLISEPVNRSNEMADADRRPATALLERPATVAPASMPRFDDDWRRWISENLMIGQSTESVLETLVQSGFDGDQAAREITLAQENPYFRGAELLRNRLAKRDWLLSTYRKLGRLHPLAAEIERRPKLTRNEFFTEYYCANRPVIITGMIDDWPALTKWNLDYFARHFGDRVVEVQMGRTQGANYETEREKYIRTLKFGEFVEMVRTAGETNDFYLTANNNSSNRQVLPELWEDIRQIPEYLDPARPGGFFWMGPAGTITPFHHDLTNNFMAQVIGRKRVKIAPSWDLPLMHNRLHCFSQLDGRTTAAAPCPALEEPQILECILGPGEVLFLPIGCWHFVHGVEISVTLSFTNFRFDNDFSSSYTTYGAV